MKTILKNLIDSFTTSKSGFSGRKLSAFASIIIAYVLSLKYCTEKEVVELVIVWLSFASICLGIVTIEQIIKLKNNERQTNSGEDTKAPPVTD